MRSWLSRIVQPGALLNIVARSSIESLSFGTIAAELHVAPSPRVVPASIQEEPSAGFLAAFANVVDVRRGNQNHCGFYDLPKGPIRSFRDIAKAADKSALMPRNLVHRSSFGEKPVERSQMRFAGTSTMHRRQN
jgi:hypothetical protein